MRPRKSKASTGRTLVDSLFPVGTLWRPLLFLGCFGLYLRTLCPAFMDDDSPETIAAGLTLGLQHPPSYALDALWVRLCSFLPLGATAFRINAASALLASAIVLFLAQNIVLALGKKGPAALPDKPVFRGFLPVLCALAGAFLLAFSPTYWEKALGAKGGIYLLQLLLMQAVFYCFLRQEASPKNREPRPGVLRWFYAAVFLFGVGFANHWQTQAAFLPVLPFFFFHSGPSNPWPARLKNVLVALALFFTGGSVLLFLPLRSKLHPGWNLGAPDHFFRFIASFFRTYVADREPGLLGTAAAVLRGQSDWGRFRELFHHIVELQGPALGAHLVGDMGWTALGLVGLGLVAALQGASAKRTALFVLLPLVFLFLLFFTALWVPEDVPHGWLLDNYLLSSNWMVAFLASLGLYTAARWLKPAWLWMLFPAFFLLLALSAAGLFPRLDEQYQVLRYDYGANLLKSVPEGAILMGEGDEDNFPLFYFQAVEGRRPDLRFIPAFTLFESWGVEQVERLYPDLGLTASSQAFPNPLARIVYASSEIVVKNRDRNPLAFSRFNGAFHRYYLALHPDLAAWPTGVAYLLDGPPAHSSKRLSLGGLRLRHWMDCPSNNHPALTGILALYGQLGLALPADGDR